jgi:hypothetical protein
MRKKSSVRRALGVLAGASMLAVMAPSAAQADTCSGYWGLNPITVGAAGTDLVTSPEVHVEICVVANGDPTQAVPELNYQVPGSRWYVILDFPDSSPTEAGVRYRYSVDGDYTEWSRTVPVTGASGDVCVFYWGSASYNPGGCLAYIDNE